MPPMATSSPPPEQIQISQPGDPDRSRRERLWTPWRMRYVGGPARGAECVFCDAYAGTDDVAHLVLHRGEHCFIIMNLFPYNTGHVMLVPNQHVNSPEVAEPAAMTELALLRGPVLRAFRRALSCHAFNLGLNVGPEAGAGIAEHMHEHVVPRWTGDASFMPILANTMVLPELIPVTYARLRAELTRELFAATMMTVVVVSQDRRHVLITGVGEAISFRVPSTGGVWPAVRDGLRPLVPGEIALLGWAGGGRATGAEIQLTVEATPADPEGPASSGARWVPVAATPSLPAGAIVESALRSLHGEQDGPTPVTGS